MIVTTQFPDLPPRPETAANAAFRRGFAARWGRENVVFLASARRMETPPLPSALSVKLVEHGAVRLRLPRRQVVLQPGLCWVLNEGQRYEASIAGEALTRCYSVHFRPGLAAEVAQARRLDWGAALESTGREAPAPLLREHLQAPSAATRAALATIRARALAGERDGEVYEPLFIELLNSLLEQDEHGRERLGRLDAARAATRDELARRAGWAHDFILGSYAEPITLAHIAQAAHLSRFHLLRVFRQLYGSTPHALLQARRAEVAAALLRAGQPDLAAVAEAAGFASRWTMQRALRRHCGGSARVLRAAARTEL